MLQRSLLTESFAVHATLGECKVNVLPIDRTGSEQIAVQATKTRKHVVKLGLAVMIAVNFSIMSQH